MADIFIYDDIGPEWAGMVSAKGIIDSIMAAGNEPITVRINSPGGSVNEAAAIYNAIAAHPDSTAIIEGIAASSASYVAMAAKKIKIAENAKMMIHPAWTFVAGNKTELLKTAELLGSYDATIAAAYSARSGKPMQDIMAAMEKETWFTAKEAVDYGLADEIGQKLNVKASIPPGRFLNTPQDLIDTAIPKQYAKNRDAYRLKLLTTSRISR